jgi:small-conductance mechanosensitive channel
VAGIGAHTLLKDVTSGTFYLLDDAFRVGEYIQSGSYKGTVESFSLRSVKLRHHRGPVYTVPFGQLGAVQNMSRDWAIDKFQIGVTYDIDLDRARKLIKKLGAELAEIRSTPGTSSSRSRCREWSSSGTMPSRSAAR